jgi:excisionase family DNA binding protein
MNGALTPQEAAERLGVSRITVLRLLRTGRLQAVKLGWRTWRIPEASLEAFVRGEAAAATPNKPKKPNRRKK